MLPGIFVLDLVTLVWRELRIPKALVPGSSPSQSMPSNHSVTRINKGSTGDYPLSVHCERMLPEMHENA
jgi:hypothetical protein